MNKNVVVIWGILTFLPIFYFVYFFSSFFWLIPAVDEPQEKFEILIKLHIFSSILTMALIVSYIVYLFRTSNVPNDKKPLWAVVIFMGHILTMPIFWYLYVWRPKFQEFTPVNTGNKNQKGNKNLIRALLIMFSLCFLLPLTVPIVVFSYFELTSPWANLQEHYAFYEQVDYQDNKYEIALSTREDDEHKTFYYTKLMLSNAGFYFALPTEFHGPTARGNPLIFLRPLFIPWTSIKECRKIQYADYTKMRFQIEKTNIQMDISQWDFLKPLCLEKGIPVIEN